MTVSSASTKPPTTQEAVLAALRRDIGTGLLPPGSPIGQDALAERYGVSRVPLREALKVLEGEGQVVHLPHRGYVVAELSVADLVEVYRLRELLEAEAIRTAVPLLTTSGLRALRAAAADVVAAGERGDLAEVTAANRRFHFLLFETSGQPRLVRLLRVLWDATDVYRTVYFGHPRHRSRVDLEHAAMLDALADGDAEAVVRLQAQHRSHSVAAVRAAIEAGLA